MFLCPIMDSMLEAREALGSSSGVSVGLCFMSDLGSLGSLGALAESAGIASLWVGEYFQSPYVRLAILASATERVAIGTHLAQAWARSPLAAAIAAMELQQLSGNRLVLGLGGQVPAVNRKWHGTPTAPTLADLADYVGALKAILAAGGRIRTRYTSDRFNLDIPPYAGREETEVPLIGLGGAGPRSLDLAARIGDVVFGHLFAEPGELVRAVAVASSGKDSQSAATTIARLIAPSSVPGWEVDAARQLAIYALTPSYQNYLAAAGLELRPTEMSAALRESRGSSLVSLAAGLLDRFCVFDSKSLRETLRTARDNSIASVIFVAPYVQGATQPAERYERAAIELFKGVLN